MSEINVYALNVLNLSHYYRSSINKFDITDTLALTQSISVTGAAQHINQKLELSHRLTLSGPYLQPTNSELVFTDSAVATVTVNPYVPPTTSIITFNHSVIARKVLSKSVTSALALTQGVTSYKLNRNYIGVDVTLPTTTITGIALHYGSLTIQLKSPEFDDVYKYQQERINRRTRGGDLEIFRDTAWPVNETLVYSFKDLKRKDAYDLLSFVEQSLGQYILLTDYIGYTWQGIITTPSKEIVQEGRKNYNASFEFIGTIVG